MGAVGHSLADNVDTKDELREALRQGLGSGLGLNVEEKLSYLPGGGGGGSWKQRLNFLLQVLEIVQGEQRVMGDPLWYFDGGPIFLRSSSCTLLCTLYTMVTEGIVHALEYMFIENNGKEDISHL